MLPELRATCRRSEEAHWRGCMKAKGQLTRRRFVKGAVGAAAAGALGPTIVPRSVLGAEERPAPSNRVNMGFIGMGGQGTHDMLALLGQREVQALAVCDVDKRHRDRARENVERRYSSNVRTGEYRGCDTYSDYRELLERKDIDAVMIATPDHWHAIIAIAAAKAGKDIYCEKPLTLTIREAREMANAVRRYNRVFQTGSQQRSHGPFRQACELVRNGYLGKIHDIYVRVWGPSTECDLPGQPVPKGLDWEAWLGPAPWRPFNERIIFGGFRPYRDYSGGGVTDWGAHHFDIVQWALDMDNSGPVKFYPADPKADRPCLMYEYANGIRVWHLHGPGEKELWKRMPAPPHPNENIVFFAGDKGWPECSRGHIRTAPEQVARQVIGPNEVRLYRSPGNFQDFVGRVKTRQKRIG